MLNIILKHRDSTIIKDKLFKVIAFFNALSLIHFYSF